MIRMPKNSAYVKLKHFERKIKLPFMIYADFESILVPEGNRKQSPNESYTNKYQKYVACSYGYKLVSVDGKFVKPYLGEGAVISRMIEESKYSGDMMKKHFNRSCDG